MGKKKYSIPSGITNDISSTVKLVENNFGTLNYKIVPLDAIEFDPGNPRELAITRDDLPGGPNKSDLLFDKKNSEYESLVQLSKTIEKYGVRNAVELYECGANYRLVHGERRCLASILAGKDDIPAKILKERPSKLDIRLLQLIENVQREDLKLWELLNNVRKVIKEYENSVKPPVKINATSLGELINRSRQHVSSISAVLNASEKLKKLIKTGKINSLEKAAIIARATKTSEQDYLLNLCLDGGSLKQLKQKALKQKEESKHRLSASRIKNKNPGRKVSKIALGATTNKSVVEKIINLVASDKKYTKFSVQFKEIKKEMKLDDLNSFKTAFSKLLAIMEKAEPPRS